MSLITEINRINTNKEKAKTVSVKIDNKLVELGGEQATDLNDVPNKMQKMVDNYIKYALFKNNILTQKTDVYNLKCVTNYYLLESFPINFKTSFLPVSMFLKVDFYLIFVREHHSEQIILKSGESKYINPFSIGNSHYPTIKLTLRIDKEQAYLDMYARMNKKDNDIFDTTIRIQAEYLEVFSKNISK